MLTAISKNLRTAKTGKRRSTSPKPKALRPKLNGTSMKRVPEEQSSYIRAKVIDITISAYACVSLASKSPTRAMRCSAVSADRVSMMPVRNWSKRVIFSIER